MFFFSLLCLLLYLLLLLFFPMLSDPIPWLCLPALTCFSIRSIDEAFHGGFVLFSEFIISSIFSLILFIEFYFHILGWLHFIWLFIFVILLYIHIFLSCLKIIIIVELFFWDFFQVIFIGIHYFRISGGSLPFVCVCVAFASLLRLVYLE